MPHATCRMRHAASLTGAVTQIAPVQLLPQPLEEALRAEPDEQHGALGAAHFQAFARMDRDADLAVERHQHLVAPGRQRLNAHDGARGQHEGPDGERVGVLTMMPSAEYCATSSPSTETLMRTTRATPPLWTTTSLSTSGSTRPGFDPFPTIADCSARRGSVV